MKIFIVKMNDGSWGCLSNTNNIFIVNAENKHDAEMKVRNTKDKYMTAGRYVEYSWDCFVDEVKFNENGICNSI